MGSRCWATVQIGPRPRHPTEVALTARREFQHAAAESTEFYVDRRADLSLAPGAYTIVASKGLEFRTAVEEAVLVEGEYRELRLDMRRWVRLAEESWYSADGHLHVARPDGSRDASLAAWLRAEDLHVGNILQWGNAAAFSNAFQHAFGGPGTMADAGTIVLPGQEYPRTSFFGHAMILGASDWVEPPNGYLDYQGAFAAARRAGGLAGIGHSGEWGGDAAVAVLLADDLIDFLEVFTFRTPSYDLWYEALDAGFEIAPTAGSDYPCGGGGVPPGTPRFYARVNGSLTPESWLAAVRAGRTFVTNGPVISLSVDGRGMGEELVVNEPTDVLLKATVRFDPESDHVRAVDVVRDSEVVAVYSATTAPGRIDIEASISIQEASWLAIRTFGTRLRARGRWRNSFAHSAPVRVHVAGQPLLGETRRARARIEAWATRLDELEAQLVNDERLPELVSRAADGIGPEALAGLRFALIRQIQRARRIWLQRLAGWDSAELGQAAFGAGALSNRGAPGRRPPYANVSVQP